MLTKKQIEEIREHLDKAQNPLFLFDNDTDGLCSFLLLQRFSGKGKGVPIKTHPDLNTSYLRRIKEFNSDYIFILDKPVVSKEFFDEVHKFNIPIVWIDHHEINKKEVPKFVNYYNPMFNKSKKNEPTTYLCWQATGKKEDLWIAFLGCIADKFVPDFHEEIKKSYPDLTIESEEAFEISYNSEIGKVGRMFNFGLKDRTTNVINMLRFLRGAKSPYEVLKESQKNKTMHHRFEQINTKFKKLLRNAIEIGKQSNKVLFFKFGGEISMVADLSNQLIHLFPKKIIIVAYVSGLKVNISMRGLQARDLLLKAIKGLENATGGGHKYAVGARVMVKDLDKFKENIEELITEK